MLQAISMLPQLERLSILAAYQYFPEHPTELPPGCFPMLKHLALNTLFLEDALAVANLKPMLRQLRSLDVCFDPFTNWDEVSDFSAGVPGLILTFLENSPELREFVLNTDPDENNYEPLLIREKPILSQLARLESLTLTSVIVGPSAFEDPELDWSSLRELHLPVQDAIVWSHLPDFAKIPKLESLTLTLYQQEFEIQPFSGPASNLMLHTVESKSSRYVWCKPGQMDQVARYVHRSESRSLFRSKQGGV
jgi:hypothetical protein